MQLLVVTLLCIVVCSSATVYFKDDLAKGWESRWVVSTWKKDSGEAGEWKVSGGKFHDDTVGLQTTQDARFYAISAKFPKAFSNKDKKFVVSYSVKH